ncbi:MAG TPA: GNAT family N-acetyltransferase [Pseudonocardiaceae bacterium]|nr:GNAT family N-acetyltransferase [Pseudonocardiaceae bacterium]
MPDNRIRRIVPSDVERVVALVHELADYEKAPQECHLTVEQLDTALFDPSPALFGHVGEIDGDVVGFALWFLSFSTWRGVYGIYLEDLFVRPAHRGSGLGRALMTTLARECVERGYGRFEWSVLDWNTPAIDFYRSIGAAPVDGWTRLRLDGTALTDLSST